MRTHGLPLWPGLLLAAWIGLAPQGARGEVGMTGWYFPLPWTMNSPTTPHRFGGVYYGMTFADEGIGINFPLQSLITNEEQTFVLDLGLPLAAGHEYGEGGSFYCGNVRLGLYGNWHFMMPFGDNLKVPAAWAVGGETSVPLAGIWGSNFAYLINFPMYAHDPVAWMPRTWSIRPRAMLAIGKPVFFVQLDLALGMIVSFKPQFYFAPQWGVTLGSNPHEMVSLSLEFGGLHWASPDKPGRIPVSGTPDAGWGDNNVWAALGLRLYFGQFNMGVMGRIPVLRMFGPWESDFAFLLFFGYELRSQQPF